MTTHLHAERVKNLLFPAPQKFKLFKPFKLFTIIGHISRVTQSRLGHAMLVAPWKTPRSVVRHRAWHGSSVLAFSTLPLHLQRPLQERGAVELV